jgi:hypothetical protein
MLAIGTYVSFLIILYDDPPTLLDPGVQPDFDLERARLSVG